MSKAATERLIFRHFADAQGWLHGPDSIESREPPEPDILFTQADGTELAFELGEILWKPFAASLDSALEMPRQARKALDALDPAANQLFSRRFANAFIAPSFRDGLTKRRRERAMTPMLLHMLDLPEGFVGSVSIPAALSEIFWSVRVTRLLDAKGPQFHSSGATWIGDPTVDLIELKLGKTYEAQGPLHLLAYFATNPMMPTWQEDLQSFLDGRAAGTVQFETISVFDVNTREIRFRWARTSTSR
ncbi:hypothetical protein LJR130_003034 [Variovorax sp. LjRoot130]|uniref:hypothetical protein n=1 Tax=Variovorax sp. LjRoot130 TaxID=3342261 RepID=UPI003ECEB3A6